jgi:hypothetical protein
MTRVRFFTGQQLSASDFATEQAYEIKMRRLHNQMLHGAGVVEGLGVSIANEAGVVTVSAGFALDEMGREIIVESDSHVAAGFGAEAVCFVTIQYVERETDPVPLAKGGSEFSRVSEEFSIQIKADDPQLDPSAQALGLARLVRRNGEWALDESYRVKRPR